MKHVTLALLSLLFVNQAQAAVICKFGPTNLRAKNACVSAAARYGKIVRLDEAYGKMGMSQKSSFVMKLANGLECACDYYLSMSRHSDANSPLATCREPVPGMLSYLEQLKRECRE